jgi:hypothetical protein
MTEIQPAGTFARHLGAGFIRTVNDDAWLYYSMPSQPSVTDAASWEERVRAARPAMAVMRRLAELAPNTAFLNRKAKKGMYREMHILAIGTPIPYVPSRTLDEASRMRLDDDYGRMAVHDRFTLLGVRLKTGGDKRKGLWHKVAGVLESARTDDGAGIPDTAFAADRGIIADILSSAGCVPPTEAMMRRALAWWQTDLQPETAPLMVEHEHMHVFPNFKAARLAEDYRDTRIDCGTWTRRIRFSYPMTIVSLGALPFNGQDESATTDSSWGARLMCGASGGGEGALAVSIRGLVEPGEATRQQIDRDKERTLDKVEKQYAEGHKTNLKVARELEGADSVYQEDGRPRPTLIDTHVHAAIPRIVERAEQMSYPGEVRLNPERQDAAFQDMMIGSTVSWNPSPVYWPSPILAYAGLNGISVAGEDTGAGRQSDLPGALLGFTEADRQPVYCSPFASRFRHVPPYLVVIGDTGSGKTRVLLHLAAQWGRLPDPDHPGRTIPLVFADPKPNSDDFGPFVASMGGRILRLDSPDAEGILDPFRCMAGGEEMRNTAVEMISQMVGESDIDRVTQSALMSIIGYGERHGADCTGEAVKMAHDAFMAKTDGGEVSPRVEEIYPALERQAMTSQIFRLIYGRRHGGIKLSVAAGMTLLSAGTLDIVAGKQGQSVVSVVQRWAVRMMFLGASSSIMGRNGVVVMDESWAMLGDPFGVSVAQRAGRLARAQHYQPVLASQKIDEFVDAGLSEYISRGIILATSAKNEGESGNPSQAQAACRLLDQPLDGRLHSRMKEAKVLDEQSNRPNYESLYALFDPDSGRLVRGTVPYYVGLDGTAIPVEVRVPDTLS